MIRIKFLVLFLSLFRVFFITEEEYRKKRLGKRQRGLIHAYWIFTLLYVLSLRFVPENYIPLCLVTYTISILALMCAEKRTKKKVISWILNLFVTIILMGISFFFVKFGAKFLFFWLLFPALYLVLWSGGLLSKWKTFTFWCFIFLAACVYGLMICLDFNVIIILIWYLGCLIYPYFWASGILDEIVKKVKE